MKIVISVHRVSGMVISSIPMTPAEAEAELRRVQRGWGIYFNNVIANADENPIEVAERTWPELMRDAVTN